MSVVVAIKEKGKVYVGADSQMSNGTKMTSLANPNNFKIWKIDGKKEIIMGCVGYRRDSDVVKCIDGLIDDQIGKGDKNIFKYVVNKVVPKIIGTLKSRNYIKMENDYFDEMNSRFLLVYKDHLFVILDDGAVYESDDFAAIGSGEDFAIGVLTETVGQEPKTRLIKAIRSAITGDRHINYPIVLTDTGKSDYEILFQKDLVNFKEGD